MKNNIVGRKREIAILEKALASPHAELITVYGRRRVGKTFLIKEYFNNKFDFFATGIFEGKQRDELKAFCDGFGVAAKQQESIKTWMEAFMALREFLKKKRKEKVIVFLDEMPWFDVPPGHFLKAFEWFWNSWGSTQKNLKFIVCGSATSWMINKIIGSKGGLYNRTTTELYLEPFNLAETELLLKHLNFNWSRELILNTYMIFGGVPYYLQLLDKNLSLDKNVDVLLFNRTARLKNEYEFLLKSLFKDAEYYGKIIDAVTKKNEGITRNEIIEESGVNDNGALTKALKNLVACDFIREYGSYGKKQRDSLFQMTDPFILFHKRFVNHYTGKDENFWINSINSPRRRAWEGIAFESICLLHVNEIKEALGISGVATWVGGWYFAGNRDEPGAQIDLLIDRDDRVINICEIKYSVNRFEITKSLDKKIMERNEIFMKVTSSRKALSNILITTLGIRSEKYASRFTRILTLNDLFK